MKGIYGILNILNNKYYIGSANDLRQRWWQHKTRLNCGDHHNKHLQSAWNKYNKENFLFVVLEYTENLEQRENHWIQELKAIEFGYNKRIDAASNRGYRPSEETKLKMSLAQKGKKLSPEHLAKIRGRKFSEQAKLNIGKASKGRKLSDAAKAKVSAAGLGRIVSEETRKKIAKSLRNRNKLIITSVITV